jgi:F1F0 ATPase subunit 2
MNEIYIYLLAFGAGIGIGLFYFGGLWLTTRRLATTSRPGLLLIGSFVGRLGLSLPAFYLVAGGRWERLLVTIVGFFTVRFFLVHHFGNLNRQKA